MYFSTMCHLKLYMHSPVQILFLLSSGIRVSCLRDVILKYYGFWVTVKRVLNLCVGITEQAWWSDVMTYVGLEQSTSCAARLCCGFLQSSKCQDVTSFTRGQIIVFLFATFVQFKIAGDWFLVVFHSYYFCILYSVKWHCSLDLLPVFGFPNISV